MELDKHIPRNSNNISFKKFQNIYYEVLMIEKNYPGTASINKFLEKLVTKNNKLKVVLQSRRDKKKFIVLLWHLWRLRPNSLPYILAIYEILITNSSGTELKFELQEFYISNLDEISSSEYASMWVQYFQLTNGGTFLLMQNNSFMKSINSGLFHLFNSISCSYCMGLDMVTPVSYHSNIKPILADQIFLFR